MENPTQKLSDYPLWRLLVMLDDAERMVGSDSDTARALAAAVQQKLRGNRFGNRSNRIRASVDQDGRRE